ncbi:MAG: SPOR domain-containing protein [Alishewanella agri]|nr:SPOR domain-containing protein [Alishewanella agri]
MSATFKHRLLGTSILLMLAIIFLPDLLDGQKQVVKDDFRVIPERPEFLGVQQVTPFDEANLQQAEASATPAEVDEQPLDQQPTAASELPSQQFASVTVGAETPTNTAAPAVSPAPVASTPELGQAAWVVRVGSFSNSQNANALVTKLRQEGFATFTRNITNSNGQALTSVFVGPEIRREKLEQGLPKLRQLTGVERLVISNYQPTENN